MSFFLLGSFVATEEQHRRRRNPRTDGGNINRNWKTFDERSFDFCQGITLHHLPGHTDGLVGMQINLPDSGTIFFISDHCHVIENVSRPFSRFKSLDFQDLWERNPRTKRR